MMRRLWGNHHAVLWGIFALALFVRAYGLPAQPPTDDEVGTASAALNYVTSGLFGQVMWYHPPLRNIVILTAGKLFGGYSAWGLRGGSLLFGSAAVLLLGYLVHGLFGKRTAAYIAAFFLAVDPLHIYLSRVAFQETTTSFFIVAGTLASLHAIRKDNVLLCYLSGALYGIASASKWNGLFPWAVSAASYLLYPWLCRDRAEQRQPGKRLLTAFSAYLVVPVAIYTALYLPWLQRGYSLGDFAGLQAWLVKHQYFWKGTPYTEDILSHRAYQWFLWPVAWVDFVFHQGKAYLSIAMGNLLAWVLTLPALFFAVREWLRSRTFELGYVLAIFFASYLPLLLTTRSIWVFIATPLLVFAFTLSSYAVDALLERRALSARTVIVYLAFVLALSAIMYPMSTFQALDHAWMKPLAEFYTPHR
ncbi:MAG: phospholipid carrier-dependent glycosyltransferase [Nitrospirota bacterium]|nr:phospholipid carrier-dependent glycosyltransferase [Nitrospirota bacterium]